MVGLAVRLAGLGTCRSEATACGWVRCRSMGQANRSMPPRAPTSAHIRAACGGRQQRRSQHRRGMRAGGGVPPPAKPRSRFRPISGLGARSVGAQGRPVASYGKTKSIRSILRAAAARPRGSTQLRNRSPVSALRSACGLCVTLIDAPAHVVFEFSLLLRSGSFKIRPLSWPLQAAFHRSIILDGAVPSLYGLGHPRAYRASRAREPWSSMREPVHAVRLRRDA